MSEPVLFVLRMSMCMSTRDCDCLYTFCMKRGFQDGLFDTRPNYLFGADERT